MYLTRFLVTRLCPLCVPIRITSPVRISLNNTRDSRHPDGLSLTANEHSHNNIILFYKIVRVYYYVGRYRAYGISCMGIPNNERAHWSLYERSKIVQIRRQTSSSAVDDTLLMSASYFSFILLLPPFSFFCRYYIYRAIFGQWLLRGIFHEFVRVGSQPYDYIDVHVPVRYTKTIINSRCTIIMYNVFLSFLFSSDPTMGESK